MIHHIPFINPFTFFTLLFLKLVYADCEQPSVCTRKLEYNITFRFDWDTDSDRSFPSTLDVVGFNGIICASHNENYTMWANGEFISSAIDSYINESMDPQPLLDELNENKLGNVINRSVLEFDHVDNFTPNIGSFNLTLPFQGENNYTRISCISKIRSSPDWFIGLSSENLCCGSKFNRSFEKRLLGFDAGIDDSTQYGVTSRLAEEDFEIVRPVVDIARRGFGTAEANPEEDAPEAVLSTEEPTPTPTPKLRHSCFPANQYVMLQDSRLIPMHQLDTYHHVRTSLPTSHSKVLTSSPIFMFTHRDHNTISQFIKFSYFHNNTSLSSLTISPQHYIYRYTKNHQTQLVLANQIQVGDMLVGFDGLPRIIERITNVYQRGLYNPQSIDGNLIVGGVLASCYTSSVQPKMATALLTPLRILYHLGCNSILDSLSNHVSFSRIRYHIDELIQPSFLAN